MGSVADDIGPETAVRPPPRDPTSVPSTTAVRPAAADPQAPRAQVQPAPRPSAEPQRRYRQTIHRVDLWSVLKISVCFYICGMAVTMVALVALWAIADAAGVIHSVEKFMGDLYSDMSSRGGRVQGTDSAGGGYQTIFAEVPLREVTTYARTLSSMTGGQGSFTMELSHYDIMPTNVQQDIVSKTTLHEEEEE